LPEGESMEILLFKETKGSTGVKYFVGRSPLGSDDKRDIGDDILSSDMGVFAERIKKVVEKAGSERYHEVTISFKKPCDIECSLILEKYSSLLFEDLNEEEKREFWMKFTKKS
jgi:hypothetical protein